MSEDRLANHARYKSLLARPELADALVASVRRRNVLVALVVILILYAGAGLALILGVAPLQRLLDGVGPYLALLPGIFLLVVAVFLSPFQARDDLRREARTYLDVGEEGFVWTDRRRRLHVAWSHLKGVYAMRGPRRHSVLVQFAGGRIRYFTDWRDVDAPIPDVEVRGGRLLAPADSGELLDVRKTPPAEHDLTQRILARSGLELR